MTSWLLTAASVAWMQSPRFALVLMAILGAHEAAHRAAARAHGVEASWPWFLPAPFFVGTLGALLRLRGTPRTRDALVEIGASGPIAGLAVASAVLLIHRPETPGDGGLALPGWFRALGVPATADDPVLYAVWVGCLVTGMNLLPYGQLDGGHVLAGVWPRRPAALRHVLAAGILLAGLRWWWWWPWLGAVHLLGAAREDTVALGSLSVRARVVATLAGVAAAGTWMLQPW